MIPSVPERLNEWESAGYGEDTGDEKLTSEDGRNKGSAVFPSNLGQVTQSMQLFKSNFGDISLATGVMGFDAKVQNLSCVYAMMYIQCKWVCSGKGEEKVCYSCREISLHILCSLNFHGKTNALIAKFRIALLKEPKGTYYLCPPFSQSTV